MINASRFPTVLALVLVFAVLSSRSAAAQQVKIGVAGPFSGSFALLGEQMKAGAAAFRDKNSDVSLVFFDDGCTPEGGEAAAKGFVDQGVVIATGFLCTEAVESALPILSEAGIPIISTGVRTARVSKRTSGMPPIFRISESSTQEAEAVSRIIVERWRNELFAIVDDGTIYARELAEALRIAAENAGLDPAYIDTFRPQLENQIGLAARLKKAGVTHLFAAGDRSDIAIIARDAEVIGHEVVIAGGEALLASDGDIPLPEGVLAVAPNDIVKARSSGPLESTLETSGYWMPQYAALEIAFQTSQLAKENGSAIREVLTDQNFQTVMGAISFNDEGFNTEARFGLYRYDGEKFTDIEG